MKAVEAKKLNEKELLQIFSIDNIKVATFGFSLK